MEKVTESPFQFKDIRIVKFDFDRKDVIPDGNYDISVSRSVEVFDTITLENGVVKEVSLNLDVNSDVFNISTKISGDFRCSGIKEEVADKLFLENAPALLLSYLRPAISFITSQAKIPYDLPYLNFSNAELVKE